MLCAYALQCVKKALHIPMAGDMYHVGAFLVKLMQESANVSIVYKVHVCVLASQQASKQAGKEADKAEQSKARL